MTTRNLFDRPELLDSQTRLILSADARPRRLSRSTTRSAGQNISRERFDSEPSTSPFPEEENDFLNENEITQSRRRGSTIPDDIDYDTDIELDDEQQHDYTCKGIYLEQCRRYGVIPSTHYLRSIENDNLTIRYCGLKPINIRVMVPSLIVNSIITKLDLRDNGLGSKGAIYIAHLIQENEYIDHLNISNNDIGTQGCKALCQVLSTSRSIRILYLDGNRFNDDCASFFADVFSHNESITYINLNKNFFENESTGRLFGQSLCENQTLEELHLAWNRLTAKACAYLLKPLGPNIRLTTIDISWNGGNLLTAKAIYDLLRNNKVLEKLHLESNKFNTECGVHISKGLVKNETLKIITLNGNPLESSGCYAILRPLLKHPTSQLQLVDFRRINTNKDFSDLVTELRVVLPQLHVEVDRDENKKLNNLKS